MAQTVKRKWTPSTAGNDGVRPISSRLPGLGVVGGLLVFLGASSFGDTPDTRDTTAQVAAYFTTNRTSVLIGAMIFATGLLCLLAVTARLSAQLEAVAQQRIGRFVHSVAATAVALLLGTVVLINASLSYVIGAEAPELAKGLFELTLVATPVVDLLLAAFLGASAVGLYRGGVGKRWFVGLSSVMAVLLAIGAGSFAYSGPFSPDVQQQVMLLILLVWLMASGRGLRERAQAG